jgi:hypothetical protein
MGADEAALKLLPAPEDSAPNSAEYQRALWDADRELRARGAKSQSIVFMQDDAEAGMTHLGEVVVKLAPAAMTAIGAVAGAWLQARYGRKVRIKYRDAHGDVEAEASTPKEVERLLKTIPQDRAGTPPTGAPKTGGEP